jgi:mannosyltransferase OCH1-like enzyme
MFPKIIHQIWYQGVNKIPNKYTKLYKTVTNTNPLWHHIIWDDHKVQKHFKNKTNILNTYNNFPYLHQKVDFIRYCILYEFGGIYLDMDVTVLKSFDKLVNENKNYECILSTINLDKLDSYIMCQNSQFVNNGIIIAKKQSKFIKSIIDYIIENPECKWFDLSSSMCVYRTTGPALFSRLYKNYAHKDKIKLLHWSYLEPCLLGDICDITDHTYTIHHHDVTWIHNIIATIVYYYLKYNTLVRVVLLIILIQIAYYIFNYVKQR